MAKLKDQKDSFCITIPISGVDEIRRYQQGIMSILGKIHLDDCDPESIEHLKVVYALLNHLSTNERRLSNTINILKING